MTSRSTADGPASTAPTPVSVWPVGPLHDMCTTPGCTSAPDGPPCAGRLPDRLWYRTVAAFSRPGDLVLVADAVHLLHPGALVVAVTAPTREHGCGYGHVVTGDARHLPRLRAGLPDTVPAVLRGQAALVVTSPPYGRNVHGQVTARPGHGVTKHDYRYAPTRRGSANLAHTSTDRLLAGFTTILTAAAQLLRPGGHVVVTARPWRDHGHLVDLPSAVLAAGQAAGLIPVERCVALLAGLRGAGLVPRASFFQLTAVRNARDNGTPLHVIAHEDVYVFSRAQPGTAAVASARREPGNPPGRNLRPTEAVPCAAAAA